MRLLTSPASSDEAAVDDRERRDLLIDDITALCGELMDLDRREQRPWCCPGCLAREALRNAEAEELGLRVVR